MLKVGAHPARTSRPTCSERRAGRRPEVGLTGAAERRAARRQERAAGLRLAPCWSAARGRAGRSGHGVAGVVDRPMAVKRGGGNKPGRRRREREAVVVVRERG
eukprot:5816316-Lingulodinium_polyedra.AAC.1